MMQDDSFARIAVEDWRQFGRIDIDLSSRLTILTGANGTGKTTLVTLLGRHFNWSSAFVGLPVRSKDGRITYLNGVKSATILESGAAEIENASIGSLTYSNGQTSTLSVPTAGGGSNYDITFSNQQSIPGLYLASHRSLSSYREVQAIPSQFSASGQILQQYIAELWQRWLGSYSQKSSMLLMKESLLAAAIFSEGNSSVEGSSEAAEVWNGFQAVLRELMPSTLKFVRLAARPPEIVVETRTGNFVIDAVSGGLSALLEVAWQIFLRSREYSQFTVCMDEPENHLHPSLQRSIIPSLLRAFPSVKFVVATHSPFVVTSQPDANVYALDYDNGVAYSKLLDFADKSASAERTLREVLGVETTIPVWAEERFNEIIDRYAALPVDQSSLIELRGELEREGLGSTLSQALNTLLPSIEGEGGK
ncbi:putative ATPase [Amycolatopsis umgeniensis]|uniref:Putative ATPase n=2 Tax=Amycolatopsis umgeniensis TaxID=336628 RepID=A0A841BGF1_9PSEU|nr:putative ATPase [Amycolatopsis umgeniensis]